MKKTPPICFRRNVLLFALLVAVPTAWFAVAALAEQAPREPSGLRPIADTYFPVPEEAEILGWAGGDFETDGQRPPGWVLGGGEIVAADDAPQGKAYYRFPARRGTIFITPRETAVPPGAPYFLSLWLRSPEDHWTCIGFTSDERLRSYGDHYPGIPSTENQWRRVGYYVWMPAQCRTLHLQIQPHKDSPEGEYIAVDDLRLRTASEAEMSAAYEAERRRLPAYDAAPRPGDGANLALSVAKWERRAGVPGRPFLIWAVGSSWTNFQGDGYPLIRAIRERFPDAPPIVYKKHAGSGTPWDYARGWVQQFVAAEQPDLILTYTNGSPEGLEAMLSLIRRTTTADVIVPSLHFFENSTLTEADIERGLVPWDEIREICRRHGAEFVENRRELAAYLQQHELPPTALLGDVVHQNQHGRIRIWDNITRHVARPEQFNYAPESRERWIALAQPRETATEQVAYHGEWIRTEGVARTAHQGARITLRFHGNRVDLIGRRVAGGGTLRVKIDGRPAEEAPAFVTNYIVPKPNAWPLKLQGPGPGDIAPHAVGLGENIVPQSWMITMTSESGDFRLEGSTTGDDGAGNVAEPFVSRSGQIRLDPQLWRNGRIERRDGEVLYGNQAGDTFTFDVMRAAVGEVHFDDEEGAGPFSVRLAQNLANGPHTLELTAEGDGEVVVEALYVYEPPEKP